MKFISFILAMLMTLTILLSSCTILTNETDSNNSSPSEDDKNDSSTKDNDPFALDPSIPYELTFTSNGDGTCYVSDIKFNSIYNEEFDIVIPETSPDRDTVTRIAWGDAVDSVFLTMPRFITPERLNTVGDSIYNELYEKTQEQDTALFFREKFVALYAKYDISEMTDGRAKDEIKKVCPMAEFFPICVIDSNCTELDIVFPSRYLDISFSHYAHNDIKELIFEKVLDSSKQQEFLDMLLEEDGKIVDKYLNCSTYAKTIVLPDTVESIDAECLNTLVLSDYIVISKSYDISVIDRLIRVATPSFYFEFEDPSYISSLENLGNFEKYAFYSESEPDKDTPYNTWHYVNGKVTLW